MRNTKVDWIALVLVTIAVVVGVTMKLFANRGADMSQAQLMEHIERKSGLCILDVRSAQEYGSGHLPGAINIGHKEIPARLDELEPYKDKDVVVYCERGVRAKMARKTLTKAGFSHVFHLAGDMAGWRDAGLATETPDGTESE